MKVLWIKQVSLMFSKQSNKVLNGIMTELNSTDNVRHWWMGWKMSLC